MTRGWAADGDESFPYTLDWDGTPVVRARMHWVIAEAVGAAAVRARHAADDAARGWYGRLWRSAADHHIDPERGSWIHEVDMRGGAPMTWEGKPDLYHAVQATLLPQGELTPVPQRPDGRRRRRWEPLTAPPAARRSPGPSTRVAQR